MNDKLDELHLIYKMIGNYGFCTVQELLDNYNNLQQRNDKAIKCVEDYKEQWCRNDEVINDMNELLSILKGEDK